MCPGFTSSRYHEGWTYSGGALNLAFVASWTAHLASASARRRGDDAAVRALDAASDFPQFDRNLQTGGPLYAEGPTAARIATEVVLHERGFASRVTLPVAEG
jgi:predicted acyl esterase